MGSFIDFWNGGPFVIDADLWTGIDGLNPVLNRSLCIMMFPFHLVMAVFHVVFAFDLMKLAAGIIRRNVFPSARSKMWLGFTLTILVTSLWDCIKAPFMFVSRRRTLPEEKESADGYLTKMKAPADKIRERPGFNGDASERTPFSEESTASGPMPTSEDSLDAAAVSADFLESSSYADTLRLCPAPDSSENLHKPSKHELEQWQLRGHISFQDRASKHVKQTPGTWKIYDREYDLDRFMPSHPGGEWVLQLSRDSDCTILFESYHVMVKRDKLEKMMKCYELESSAAALPEGVPQLPPDDEMYSDLKQMVRSFFEGKPNTFGGKPWKMNYEVALFRGVALFLGHYMVYRLLFLGDTRALILSPLLHWLAGSSLAHEAGHFAAFSNGTWNYWACVLGAWPLQFNSHGWMLQHTIQHHQFTDQHGDVDLFHFLPLARTSREHTKWDWIFKYQWLTMFFLLPTVSGHLTYAAPIDLLLARPVFTGPFDSAGVPKEDKHELRYEQCQHLQSMMHVLGKPMLLELCALMTWLAFIVANVGPYKGLLYYTLLMMCQSLIFAAFTQGAHINEDAMLNVEGNARLDRAATNDNGHEMTLQGFLGPSSFQNTTFTSSNLLVGRWLREQIAYTVDFSPESRFWHYCSGGLNMQTFHHVFPGISHDHLRQMYPNFLAVCKKHHVEVREVGGFVEFCRGFTGWITSLSAEFSVEGKRD